MFFILFLFVLSLASFSFSSPARPPLVLTYHFFFPPVNIHTGLCNPALEGLTVRIVGQGHRMLQYTRSAHEKKTDELFDRSLSQNCSRAPGLLSHFLT